MLCSAIYVACVSKVIKAALIRFGSPTTVTLNVLRFIEIEIKDEKWSTVSAKVIRIFAAEFYVSSLMGSILLWARKFGTHTKWTPFRPKIRIVYHNESQTIAL